VFQFVTRHAPAGLAALLVIETADLIFAVDSLPAVLAVTHDSAIAVSSNLFAILGLRSLFFVVSGAMRDLRYLGAGLAAILSFVGARWSPAVVQYPDRRVAGRHRRPACDLGRRVDRAQTAGPGKEKGRKPAGGSGLCNFWTAGSGRLQLTAILRGLADSTFESFTWSTPSLRSAWIFSGTIVFPWASTSSNEASEVSRWRNRCPRAASGRACR
jgi:hypothetical protein